MRNILNQYMLLSYLAHVPLLMMGIRFGGAGPVCARGAAYRSS
jgi:hypothetical protein